MRYLKHLVCMGIGWDDGKQQIINRNNSVVLDRVAGIKSGQGPYENKLHNQSNSVSYVVPKKCKKDIPSGLKVDDCGTYRSHG